MARPNKQARNAIAARRKRVAELYLQGVPQYQIAEQLDVGDATISEDMADIRQQWAAANVLNYDSRLAEEASLVRAIFAEAWAGYVRSKSPKKKDRAKRTEGLGKDGNGTRRDAETVTEGRDGNPKFLSEARACRELMAKLFGLLPTKERDPLDVLLEYLPAELARAVRAEIDRQLSGGGTAPSGQPQSGARAAP